MPGKTESSSASKKSETAAKKPADKSQQGVTPAGAGYESYLGEGQPGMDSLNAYLEGADEATRSRVVTELQRELNEIPLPPKFSLNIAGDWEQQQESFRVLTQGLILAVVLGARITWSARQPPRNA